MFFRIFKPYLKHSSTVFFQFNHHKSIKLQFNLISQSIKSKIDRSKFPVIHEKDLEETFINGFGPGGQNVNKRKNCVFLRHLPTNIFVKCHESRNLESNRKIARKLLLTKLDNHLNGEQSVEAQQKRIELELKRKKEEQAKLRLEKKLKLKEHLKSLEQVSSKFNNQSDKSEEVEIIEKIDDLNKLNNMKKSN